MMEIAPALLDDFNALNAEQKDIVTHKQGPLLVIAGPGSGKTHSLTLLAMNLLLCGDAEPAQLVLCTYTERAAHELHDRIIDLANKAHYEGDISQIRVGTIHSICQRLVNEHLHRTPFSNNYTMLDQFTQQLLIYQQLEEICCDNRGTLSDRNALATFRNSWGTEWDVAGKLQFYFNMITDDLIFTKMKHTFPNFQSCKGFKERLLFFIICAYNRYRHVLVNTNSIDFAYMQKCAHSLLEQPDIAQRIVKNIRYVLVDEYQDTNYIQEEILTLLASGGEKKNLVAIGDEDQAIYRFRGATVRNILLFTTTFPDCQEIRLTTNYRSHPGILATYNQWMESLDWSNLQGPPLRTPKSMQTNRPTQEYHDYPSTVRLDSDSANDEAEQFAEMVERLKQEGKIADYGEVALLLNSVRYMGGPYIAALEKRGIPVYCPRARNFFNQEEIILFIGCLARLLQYSIEEALEVESSDFVETLNLCQSQLAEQCQRYLMLEEELQSIEDEIFFAEEEKGQTGEHYLADYFYRLIFLEPFSAFLDNENQRANLVMFSTILQTFQRYYPYKSIGMHNLKNIGTDFFARFLVFLAKDGLNEDEDQSQEIWQGHVQIMTIYQAKGLEFPVVMVGRLDNPPTCQINKERRDFQQYYDRPSFEPERRIPDCDRRRLYYVAFSRAKKLLALSAKPVRGPHTIFSVLWHKTPSWNDLNKSLSHIPEANVARAYTQPKPRYGVTTHIQTYQTCPRRYQFFHEQRFAPSRRVDAFFGQLVHQTIELVHRLVLDGELELLNEQRLQTLFKKIYALLCRTNKRSLTTAEQEQAFHHVQNYFLHNQQKLKNIQSTEYAVQIMHNDYVLNGKIDLLLQNAEGLEVLDFKTQTRLERDSPRFLSYQQQLYLYAYALSKNQHRYPQRLSLYWTAEEQQEDALMDISCNQDAIEQTVKSIQEIIIQIQQQQFAVKVPPAASICQTCDVRRLCKKEQIIH
jgi:DNA helicase II / ATP-dependent DNA helicase PcrA